MRRKIMKNLEWGIQVSFPRCLNRGESRMSGVGWRPGKGNLILHD